MQWFSLKTHAFRFTWCNKLRSDKTMKIMTYSAEAAHFFSYRLCSILSKISINSSIPPRQRPGFFKGCVALTEALTSASSVANSTC